MGKAVILVFFVLGFIVFSFIKMASKGVKQAYRAVNEEVDSRDTDGSPKQIPSNDPDDEALSIVKIIIESLEMQFTMGGFFDDKYPSDDFVVGYVAGYCNAFTVRKAIDPNSPQGFAILTIPFTSIYGDENGPKVINRFLDAQEDMPEAMAAGMMEGGQNVFDWLDSDGDKSPLGLVKHFHGMAG